MPATPVRSVPHSVRWRYANKKCPGTDFKTNLSRGTYILSLIFFYLGLFSSSIIWFWRLGWSSCRLKKYNQWNNNSLHKVERCYRKHNKCRKACDMWVNCCSHTNQCVNRHSECSCISWKQYKCVDEASNHDHQNCSCYHSDQCTLSCSVSSVNEACRYTEWTSDNKVWQSLQHLLFVFLLKQDSVRF